MNEVEDRRKIFSVQETTTKDHATGEVTEQSRVIVGSLPRTPDFVMCFTRDFGYLMNISGAATKVLFGMLMFVDRYNEITLNRSRKDQIAAQTGIKCASINPLLSQLVKTNIVFKKENTQGIYILNPHYFGKGRWQNVAKLRMMIEYDFNTGQKLVAYEQEFQEPGKDDFIERLMENKEEFIKFLSSPKGQQMLDLLPESEGTIIQN